MARCRSVPAISMWLAALAAVTAAACGDTGETIVDARLADARTDGAIDAPVIDAAEVDAAMIDAAMIDGAMIDAAVIDGAVIDAAVIDARVIDAAAIDALVVDALVVDARIVDGGPIDAVAPIDAAAAPTLAAVVPADGLATVSTTVQLAGTNLVAGTTASFNGTAGVGCTVQSSTAMTCQAPPAAIGRGNVVITGPNGSATATGAWTYTGVRNELGTGEADYCNLQFPATITASPGAITADVYGRLYEDGVTAAPGAPAGVVAQLGLGPAGSNPTTQAGWRFVAAVYNVQVGNDDEFRQTLTAPAATGTYAYGYRISLDGGLNWTYCDLDGAGSNPDLVFTANQLGVLTVAAPS